VRRIGRSLLGALTVGVVWTAPAHGQLSLGVAAGATSSEMGGRLITSTGSDWGVLLGGYGSYRLQSNLAFQIEANWVQKGGSGTVEESRVDLSLDYVELPFTAQLVVGLSPTWDWNLYGGIALAFKTGCGLSDDSGESASCDVAVPAWSIESSEWAVPFGTSFSHRFTRSSVTADFRYSYGLSAAVDNLDLKNRSWQFIIRWGFEV